MKSKLVRIISTALLSVLLWSLLVTPIVYAYSYSHWLSFTVTDNSATERTQLPVLTTSIQGNSLAAAGYITSSGLDTALKINSDDVPFMLVSDRLAMVLPILSSGGTDSLKMYLGYSPARTTFPIIVGNGGNVTIADASNIELGSGNFSIDWKGYLSGNPGYIWQKGNNSTSIEVNASNITATVYVYTLTLNHIHATVTGSSTGYLSGVGAVDTPYATVRAFTSANNTVQGGAIIVNQWKTGTGAWQIQRGFVSFDTSGLVDPVYSANLTSYGTGNPIPDFNMVVQTSTNSTYPHTPLEAGDYDQTYYTGNGGSASTSLFPDSNFTIVLNATGISWINLGGVTKFIIRCEDDINGYGTDHTNNAEYHDYNDAGYVSSAMDVVTFSSLTPIVLNATKPSAGSCNVTLSRVSDTLGLYVNGVLKDSAPMTNKLVTDTANNIDCLDANAVPYSDYLKVSVANTPVIHYEPNTMVVGTDLIDRNGGDNDGLINWGANTNVTIATGGVQVGASVETLAATNVAATTATLNGALVSVGNYTSVSVYFTYGLTTSYGYSTPMEVMTATGGFDADITKLQYNTTYHFRAWASAGGLITYGEDLTFTTTTTAAPGGTGTGMSPSLIVTVTRGKVFNNFISTNDTLFVAEVINTYTTYYPTESSKEYFTVQLISTDNTTILGATPLHHWGDMPVSIYLNATQSANITKRSQYYIRVYNNGADNVSAQYQLQPADWEGYNLNRLDEWCLSQATNMQLSYNTSGFITVLVDRGRTITDAISGYFNVGIPAISQVRPNLFETSLITPTFTEGVAANTWDSAVAWQTAVGANIAADATVFALPFGITGKDFLSGMIAIVILGCVMVTVSGMGGFGALGALLICVPLLWLGTYFKIMPIIILAMLLIAAGIAFIRQFVVKTL